MVTPADMTDREAAKEVLFRLRLMHPEITIVWADSGYAGKLVTWAKTKPRTDPQARQPAEGRRRVRHPSPSLGGRAVPGLDHARPSACAGLRTAHSALRVADHLGCYHAHDQANHPPKFPQKRPADIPRSRPGLIVLKVRRITLARTGPKTRS